MAINDALPLEAGRSPHAVGQCVAKNDSTIFRLVFFKGQFCSQQFSQLSID